MIFVKCLVLRYAFAILKALGTSAPTPFTSFPVLKIPSKGWYSKTPSFLESLCGIKGWMKTKSINYTSKKFSFAITNCSVQVIFLEGLSIAVSKISLGWGELPIILWRIQVQARTVGKKKQSRKKWSLLSKWWSPFQNIH